MPLIAQVATPVALDKAFDYLVPDDLAAAVTLGSRVLIPFGARQISGIVVGLTDRSNQPKLKAISGVTDAHPLLGPVLLDLARWMADYYCAPLEQVLRAVLPAPVRRVETRFKERLAVTSRRPREAPEAGALTDKQRLVMERLWQSSPVPLQELLRDVGVTAGVLKTLERHGWVTLADAVVARDPLSNRTLLPSTPLTLMVEQAQALELITETMRLGGEPAPPSAAGAPASSVVLLHGVTGSGKTEVYLQAIGRALAAGRGAIVLVPEISLTPQTIDRFVSRFGPNVAVLHSRLSQGERFDEWHRIRSGTARIVVGARSAVFAPVRPLGIIVVDEEHEPSYKQEETPRYNARDVAVMRGRLEGCTVVLGSATPSLESWVNAQKGKYRLATLPVRVDDRKMPAIRILDMRANAERTGHPSVFSKELLQAISDRLARSEQTILFLNRRGYASSLTCPQCGFTAQCDHCSVAVTYHRHDERLRCHLCGVTRPVPAVCPACKDPAIRYAGFGTQRVETIIQKCFPKATIARMDTDSTSRKGAHDQILGEFRAGKIQILVGTQMIAKGLDFPNVTLVGVISADLSLHLPDFRAGERTFQLLAQVSGRAGRGHVPGEVVIQTYTPHHPSVQAARRHDFIGFADQEIEFRRELNYPPFSRLTCLAFRGVSEEKVSASAAAVAAKLTAAVGARVQVSEPIPAPIARAKNLYRYQVIVRSASMSVLAGPLREVLRATPLPAGVVCTVDVDALNLL